jgi:hypothetical protein
MKILPLLPHPKPPSSLRDDVSFWLQDAERSNKAEFVELKIQTLKPK